MRATLLLSASALLSTAACDDECESLPPTVQLEIRSPTGAASIDIVVEIGGERRGLTLNLEGALDDGETSLVVELDPALTADFELEVSVVAYSGREAEGAVLGSASGRFTGTPNGCNRFEVELRPEPPDGGPPDPEDAGQEADANVSDDGGAEDAAIGECCDPGCALCRLDCSGSQMCRPDCDGPSECTIDCIGANRCAPNCTGGSNCDVACADSSECIAVCTGGASCRLDCGAVTNCGYDDCAGGETTCADGSIVCNRSCP